MCGLLVRWIFKTLFFVILMREQGTVLEATYAYIYVKCLAKYWKLTGLKQEWIWSSHFSDAKLKQQRDTILSYFIETKPVFFRAGSLSSRLLNCIIHAYKNTIFLFANNCVLSERLLMKICMFRVLSFHQEIYQVKYLYFPAWEKKTPPLWSLRTFTVEKSARWKLMMAPCWLFI